MNCDPGHLAEQAKAFKGLPRGVRQSLIPHLLCQIVNKGLTSGCDDLQVQYTGQWLGPMLWDLGCDLGIAGVQTNGSNQPSTPGGLWLKSSFVYNETGAPLGGLTTLSFPNLVGVSLGSLSPTTMPALTSLSYPALQYVDVNFSPTTMAFLTTLSATSLAYVGGALSPTTMALLTTLSTPLLAYVGGLYSPNTMASLTSLSSTSLAYVGGNFLPGRMALLTSLSFPSLAYVGGNFNPDTMASLTSQLYPSLAYVGGAFGTTTMVGLTSFSAPALVYVGGAINIAASANVVSVVIGTAGTTKKLPTSITLSNMKLDAASVNGMLAVLVSLDGTNGTTLWGAGCTLTINGGTNAAPSGQGIIDKATLIARTAVVTTN